MATHETEPTADFRDGVAALIERDRAIVRLLQRVEELIRLAEELERRVRALEERR